MSDTIRHENHVDEKRCVRFWVWYRQGWVKLALHSDETLSFGYSEPTDEGYEYYYEYFTLGKNIVNRVVNTGGRDCDGLVNTQTELFCSVAELVSVVDGVESRADWQVADTEVYDQFAQMVGY